MRFGFLAGKPESYLERDLGISIRMTVEGDVVVRETDCDGRVTPYLCRDEDEVVYAVLTALSHRIPITKAKCGVS